MFEEYDWYCDCCNSYLNEQPGFNSLLGFWTCTECGALNDVSENNVIDTDQMMKDGVEEFTTKPLIDPFDDDY